LLSSATHGLKVSFACPRACTTDYPSCGHAYLCKLCTALSLNQSSLCLRAPRHLSPLPAPQPANSARRQHTRLRPGRLSLTHSWTSDEDTKPIMVRYSCQARFRTLIVECRAPPPYPCRPQRRRNNIRSNGRSMRSSLRSRKLPSWRSGIRMCSFT